MHEEGRAAAMIWDRFNLFENHLLHESSSSLYIRHISICTLMHLILFHLIFDMVSVKSSSCTL